MTGGGHSRKIDTPPDPAPAAMPIPGREEEEAKKKVGRRGKGRLANMLAGQLMSKRGGAMSNLLKTDRLGGS